MPIRSVVISDLHVACGALDDFDAELESRFAAFLGQLGGPVELIVNGDFLDFVQAMPWTGSKLESSTSDRIPLCFTQEQSREKLANIEAAHGPMFQGLAGMLAASPANRLVIMPGNHDPDFFWPGVQQDFRALLAKRSPVSAEQIVFHLEPSRQAAANPRVWIEHGHQYDQVNRFKIGDDAIWSEAHPPIRKAKDGVERLYECTGTRFLIKYLNRIDSEYPLVDNVKPFSRFLRVFGGSAFVAGYGTLKAALAVAAMLRFLTGTAVRRPSDLLGVGEDTAPALAVRLRTLFQSATGARKKQFLAGLQERGFGLGGQDLEVLLDDAGRAEPLLEFLAEHSDLLDLLGSAEGLLSIGGPPGTLSLARGFTADETGDLIRAAGTVAKERGAEAVVMGHTHEPVDEASDFRYINTGSWTRYLKIPKGDKSPSWKILRSDRLATFPYRLLYVDIQPGAPAERCVFAEFEGA